MTVIRELTQADLPEAQRIVRVAFGTFFGVADPQQFWGDLDYVHGRFGAEHTAAFAAENDDGLLVGSNFATRWGSVGFFGPLTTRPELWDGGIGQRLVAAACDQLDGVSAMPGCLPLRRAPSMSGSTANSVFIRGF